MMGKIPKEQLNLLMGHCHLESCIAATTSQSDFPAIDVTAILASTWADDQEAHSSAQQAAGCCHGQKPQVIWSQSESESEVKRRVNRL